MGVNIKPFSHQCRFYLDSKFGGLESETEDIMSTILLCSSEEQDFKTQMLTQVFSYIKSSSLSDDHGVVSALMSMISTNLFRPLPPPSNHFMNDHHWQNLLTVYDMLLNLVIKLDHKVLYNYIDRNFLINLLSLFQSEDHRERSKLKTIYHIIYSKLTFHCSFMRKIMNDVILGYVFETDTHCGISELLEIYGNIIKGFSLPLEEEHKLFLVRVLVPLHRTKDFCLYYNQLRYCVNQLLQKDSTLGVAVVKGILRYWPVTNCLKEVLLIEELEELVDNMINPEDYKELALPLCRRMTLCLNSSHSQVAERALYVWNNDQFVKMAASAKQEVFHIVSEGIESNLKWHWSKSVKQLTGFVKLVLQDIDPILYRECELEIESRESMSDQEARRKERWEIIESAAKQLY